MHDRKKDTSPVTRVLLKSILSVTFFMLHSIYCNAQYTPAPQTISEKREAEFKEKLSTESDELKKVDILLDLANIYYNKPLRRPRFIEKSLSYSTQAMQISKRLKSSKQFNRAQYMIALAYMWQFNFKAAEAILPTLDNPTKNDLLVSLGYNILNADKGNPDELIRNSLRVLNEARLFSIKMKNKRNELISRQYLAFAEYEQNEKNDPVKKLEDVISEFKKYKIPGSQGALLLLANIYNKRSQNDRSMLYLQETLKEMKTSGDTLAAGDLYAFLGIVFKQEHEDKKEMEAHLTSLAYYKIHPAGGNIFYGIQMVALTYSHQKKYQQALDFLNKSTREYPPETYVEKLNITSAYANAYLALKNYPLAEKYYLQKFRLVKENDTLDFDSYDRLGYFYIESKQFAKARPYLEEAFRRKSHLTNRNSISSLQYRLYLVDSAAGKYLSAIRHLNSNHSYNDTIQRAAKNSEINKLLVQYEDEKKQNEIHSLRQKAQIDLANIKRASLIRNVTLAGAALILIAAGLFYRQYGIKQKLSKEILAKNKRQEVLLSRLNRLLSEKEWLLKEVHHRVKNNLHTIISLLNIQAEFLKDDALLAIENSQHRIYAMSLIHQKLYASDDIQNIDMVEYVKELLDYMKSSFGERENIQYISEIDPLLLEVGQAMPLGLIINEAVTNSIKYAFPHQERGTISIVLKRRKDLVTMTIADDGIGIPELAQNAKLNSLGLKLIEGLSGDINAELKIENDNGTKIIIIFDPDYLKSLSNIEEEVTV